jgi:hypothetical protein
MGVGVCVGVIGNNLLNSLQFLYDMTLNQQHKHKHKHTNTQTQKHKRKNKETQATENKRGCWRAECGCELK